MKKTIVMAMLLGITLASASCGRQKESAAVQLSEESAGTRESGAEESGEAAQDEKTAEDEKTAAENGTEIEKFGSYEVPEGWVVAEKYSTQDKVFYVEEGHEEDARPDNISINIGSNKYSAEDHMKFRDAIVRQLTMQISGLSDTMLYGDGTYSEQGYTMYVFTIDEEAEGVVTKQYYIVGDHRYCLIILTDFDGSEEAVRAAEEMADSFVWKDSDAE